MKSRWSSEMALLGLQRLVTRGRHLPLVLGAGHLYINIKWEQIIFSYRVCVRSLYWVSKRVFSWIKFLLFHNLELPDGLQPGDDLGKDGLLRVVNVNVDQLWKMQIQQKMKKICTLVRKCYSDRISIFQHYTYL